VEGGFSRLNTGGSDSPRSLLKVGLDVWLAGLGGGVLRDLVGRENEVCRGGEEEK
jgi:uncharacterized membrane protein YeiH